MRHDKKLLPLVRVVIMVVTVVSMYVCMYIITMYCT